MASSVQPSACEGDANPDRRRRADRPVDLVHLARHTFGDRALEREVLDLYRTQSRRYLDRLKGADTAASWRHAAHTLKGSARGVGAWQVAGAAESAESLAEPAAEAERQRLIALVERRIEEADSFIAGLLEDG